MHNKRVLVVDDDPDLTDLLTFVFTREGAEVLHTHDGKEALRLFYEARPHLVILDLILPGLNGWETFRRLRELADTPVIILTGLQGDDGVVKALDSGVDDYVTKPVSIQILLARARAALRRVEREATAEPFRFDDGCVAIDLAAGNVRRLDKPVHLTATEYRLLAYFARHCGMVRTYQQILENVWGWEYRESFEYVHVYISRLRRKLEPEPRKPRYLLTEYGIGYRLVCPTPAPSRI
jgi:two-component system KDP operon response regulator KdpE